MNESLEAALASLARHIESGLDMIEDRAKVELERMARSTGQATRADRL